MSRGYLFFYLIFWTLFQVPLYANADKIQKLSSTQTQILFSGNQDGNFDQTTIQIDLQAKLSDGLEGDNQKFLEGKEPHFKFYIRWSWSFFDSNQILVKKLDFQNPLSFPLTIDSGGEHALISVLGSWNGQGLSGPVPDGLYSNVVQIEFVREKISGGQTKIIDSLNFTPDPVTQDTTAPTFISLFPPTGSIFNLNPQTLTGQVSESGVTLTLNALQVSLAGSSFSHSVTLSEGLNTLTLRAVDSVGNSTQQNIQWTLDTVPPSLAITSPINSQTTNNPLIPFSATYSDSGTGVNLNTLSLKIDGVERKTDFTISPTGAFFTPSQPLGDGNHTFEVSIGDLSGNNTSSTISFLVILDGSPPLITLLNPTNGSTIHDEKPTIVVEFSDESLIAQNSFLITLNGSDVTSYFTKDFSTARGNLPQSLTNGLHELVFKVSDIHGNQGIGNFQFTFQQQLGLFLTGTILDSTSISPIEGVKVSLDQLQGASQFAISDSQGHFSIPNPPVGSRLVFVDGRTATFPSGFEYPIYSLHVDVKTGQSRNLSDPIFLPRLDRTGEVLISQNLIDPGTNQLLQDVVFTNPTIANGLVEARIKAGTVITFLDGSHYGQTIFISQVPPNRTPSNLPPEFRPGLVLTVQPAGLQFSLPVEITLPNLDMEYDEGKTCYLWSLNHDLGVFENRGAMVVSGNQVIPLPGTGIFSSSWHFNVPPAPPPPPPAPGRNNGSGTGGGGKQDPGCNIASAFNSQSGALTFDIALPEPQKGGQTTPLIIQYSSKYVTPIEVFNTVTTLDPIAPIPLAFSTDLFINGSLTGTRNYWAMATDTQELVAQNHHFNRLNLPLGPYNFTVRLSSEYTNTGVSILHSGTRFNETLTTSPFGSGWTLKGHQRLYIQANQDFYLKDMDGNAKLFEKQTILKDSIESGSLSTWEINDNSGGFSQEVVSPFDGTTALRSHIDPVFGGGCLGNARLKVYNLPEAIDKNTAILSFDCSVALPNGFGGANLAAFVVEAYNNGVYIGGKAVATGQSGNINTPPFSGNYVFPLSDLLANPDRFRVYTYAKGCTGGGATVIVDNIKVTSSTLGDYKGPEDDFSDFQENAASGTLVRTMPDGHQFIFDSTTGLLIRGTQPNGQTTSYSYQNGDLISTITNPFGGVTTFTYTPSLVLQSITAPDGKVTQFQINGLGELTEVTFPDTTTNLFSYSPEHLMTARTDNGGNSFTYNYNSLYQLSQITFPDLSTIFTTSMEEKGQIDQSGAIGKASTNPAPPLIFNNLAGSHTDGNGNLITHKYDFDGNLIYTQSQDGSEVFSTFNDLLLPIKTQSKNGAETHNAFNSEGNLITTGFTGTLATTTYLYASNSLLLSETDPLGNTTTHNYDPQGNRIQTTHPDGGIEEWTYNALGQVLTYKDQGNHLTTYLYNDPGDHNLQKITDPLGGETLFQYDVSGNKIRETNPLGIFTDYTFDAMNRLLTTTVDPAGLNLVTTNTYDANGNLLTTTDPKGIITKFEYDTRNRKTRETRDFGGLDQTLTQWFYDGHGNVTQTIDPRGQTTTFQYNSLNRLSRTDYPDTTFTQNFYDVEGNLVQSMDREGKISSFSFDLGNRQTASLDPSGQTTSSTYDKNNNLLTQSDQGGNTTAFLYDPMNRVVQTTLPGNKISSTNYNLTGTVAAQSDAFAQATTFQYDSLNRPLQVTDPLGNTSSTTYNLEGLVVKTTDAEGKETLNQYDNAGRLIKITRPDGEFSTISYDQNGNRLSVTDHRNNTTNWSYDNLNREKTRTNPTGIETVSTTFDPNGNITQLITQEAEPINFTLNPDNLLTQQDFGAETLTWGYDPRGNVLTETNSVSQITNTYDDLNRPLTLTTAATTEQEALALSLGYDTRGNLVGIDDGDASIVQSFNANGLIETLTTPLGKTLTFSYNANNLLTQLDFNGQMTTTYQFDNKSRLTNIDSLQGVTPIDSHAYQFDQVDLRTSHFNLNLGTASYQYDQIDRLASAGHDYSQVTSEIFNMDPEGNILSSHDQASTTFDVANRFQAHPDYNFTFDKKGNLTQKVKISNSDKTVYTWNAVNQLTKLEFFALGGGISSPTLEFSYDPQGRRVSRTLNSTDKTSWVYMGPHIHREYRNGTLSKRFIYGPGIDNILAAEIDTNSDGTLDTTHFYLKDSLNSVSVITDDLGNPLQKYVFDSYGGLKEIQDGGGSPILAGSGNWIDQPFTYTSREYDWVTGLLYYRARTYDPTLKRFLSEDPVWGTNLNFYGEGNPINFIDPSGEKVAIPPSTNIPLPTPPPSPSGGILEACKRIGGYSLRTFKTVVKRNPVGVALTIVVTVYGIYQCTENVNEDCGDTIKKTVIKTIKESEKPEESGDCSEEIRKLNEYLRNEIAPIAREFKPLFSNWAGRGFPIPKPVGLTVLARQLLEKIPGFKSQILQAERSCAAEGRFVNFKPYRDTCEDLLKKANITLIGEPGPGKRNR